MKIDIRPFLPGQEEIVCAIHNSAFAFCITYFNILYGYKEIFPSDIATWVGPEDELVKKIWIAYLDGMPAGYACCQLEFDHDRTSQLLFVETNEGLGQSKIAVLPEYRKNGVGSALVKHAMAFYGKLGTVRAVIVLYSDNMEATYLVQSLGFSKHDFAVLWELNLLAPLPPVQINPEVIVRPLQRKDLEALTIIFQESRPDLRGTFSTLEKITAFYTRADPWAEISLVAELNGEVVGFMEFTPDGLVGIGGVLPRFRKQGIGSTLFYQLLATMQSMGKKKALVDSGSIYPDAISMYERFEFDTSRKLWVWTKNFRVN